MLLCPRIGVAMCATVSRGSAVMGPQTGITRTPCADLGDPLFQVQGE
jgi:hypothetical protein